MLQMFTFFLSNQQYDIYVYVILGLYDDNDHLVIILIILSEQKLSRKRFF